MASNNPSQKLKRPREQTSQKGKEPSPKEIQAAQKESETQETRQKKLRLQQPPKEPVEEVKELDLARIDDQQPVIDEEPEQEDEDEDVEEDEEQIPPEARENVERALQTASSYAKSDAMHRLIQENPKFAAWMRWIMHYASGWTQWESQLMKTTLASLESLEWDFDIHYVDDKWMWRPYSELTLPSEFAIASVLGIANTISGPLIKIHSDETRVEG